MDVSNFGRAWSRLPEKASYREQHLALEADWSLVCAPSRPVRPLLLASEHRAYAMYGSDESRG